MSLLFQRRPAVTAGRLDADPYRNRRSIILRWGRCDRRTIQARQLYGRLFTRGDERTDEGHENHSDARHSETMFFSERI
jgi:hypothetical protein